ncbi:MAG: hypothetical protein EZS28_027779, partial [Streblomastix strix]
MKGSSEETVGEKYPFSFVKKVDVQKQMDQEIAQISEKLNLSPDEATLALISKRWDFERLTNSLQTDQDACLLVAGIIKNTPSEQTECFICFLSLEPDKTVILPCGHKCCQQCFIRHIQIQFFYPSIDFGCPQVECKAQIFPSKIREILAANGAKEPEEGGRQIPGPQAVEQYNQRLFDDFILSQKKNFCYCLNPKCDNIIRRDDLHRHDVRCPCGCSFCFDCGLDTHDPATCKMIIAWNKELGPVKLSEQWIQDHTKPCPNCKVVIEHLHGSFIMTCMKCQFKFCWNCLQSWETHGNNHNFCVNAPVPNKTVQELKDAELRNRFEHYAHRFDDQKKLLDQAKKRLADIHGKITAYETLHKSEGSTSEFIQDSALTIVWSREFLLNFTILLFFAKDPVAIRLSEHHQAELFGGIDTLSKLTDIPVEKLDKQEITRCNLVLQK